MKRVSSCFILSFLILFIASQLSYAEPKASINKMEERFQDEECFSPMIPPMAPCDMEQMKGMPELNHSPWMHFQILNLDEKQKEALREIENYITKELIRKGADEQIAEIELRELLEENTVVDLDAVKTKLEQIAAIKTETQFIVIKSMEKMKAKLTSEQREMLKKIRSMAPRMRRPLKGMMRDTTKMPPPFAKEKGE